VEGSKALGRSSMGSAQAVRATSKAHERWGGAKPLSGSVSELSKDLERERNRML
jgi:hypothetical protein